MADRGLRHLRHGRGDGTRLHAAAGYAEHHQLRSESDRTDCDPDRHWDVLLLVGAARRRQARRILTKFDAPRSRSADALTTTIVAFSGAFVRCTADSTTRVITCSISPLRSDTTGSTPW